MRSASGVSAALAALAIAATQFAAVLQAPPAEAAAAHHIAAGPADVAAAAADLVDSTTGRRLWSRGPNHRRPIASITKVMTALVVLRTGRLEHQIRVTPSAVAYAREHDAGSAGLHAGDVLTARQLLEGMLLPSGADAAFMLAQAYGPGRPAFIRKMNGTARLLGMTDTHFANFDGLPQDGVHARCGLLPPVRCPASRPAPGRGGAGQFGDQSWRPLHRCGADAELGLQPGPLVGRAVRKAGRRSVTVSLAAPPAGRTTAPEKRDGHMSTPGTRWEVALPAGAELGERPVWDARRGALIWVDIRAGRLHAFRPDSPAAAGRDEAGRDKAGRDEVIIDLGIPIGAAAPRRGGGYILAAADGFRLTGADGTPEGGPVRPEGMAGDLRFNDGACDPAGRFWAGTVANDRRPGAGALYRLDGDGAITRVLTGITESNGLGWSPDGTTMYYIDSGEPELRVQAFDYDVASGGIETGRDLIRFEPADGISDGLIVDADGCLWIAFWAGGQLRRYSAAGELLESVILPVSCPTCPGFGGAELTELYVTSAWQGMDAGQRAGEPMAGDILRIGTAARGQPNAGYAG